MKASSKRRTLEDRQADFARFMASRPKEEGVRLRQQTGGYQRPGSVNKPWPEGKRARKTRKLAAQQRGN